MDIKELQAKLEELAAQQKTTMEHATALEARVKSAEEENKTLTAQLARATQEVEASKRQAAEAQAQAAQADASAAQKLAAAQLAQDTADFELGVTQGRWAPSAKDQFMAARVELRAGRPGWFDSQFGAAAAPPGAAGLATSQQRKSHGERPAAPNAHGLRGGNDPEVIALATQKNISRAAAARELNGNNTAQV